MVRIVNTKVRTIYQPRSENAEGRYDQTAADGRSYRLTTSRDSRPAGEGDVRVFRWNQREFNPGSGSLQDDRGWPSSAGCRRPDCRHRLLEANRYRRFQDDFGLAPIANLWADISGAVQSRSDPRSYVVQTSTPLIERCLLLTTDPGDLGPRPDLWQRHRRLRRRAVGPTLDHVRHLARGPRPGAHPADVRPVPLLPAGRFAGRRAEGAGAQRRRRVRRDDPGRRADDDGGPSQGLRLQACPARHLEVHRQQRGDRRHPCQMAGDARSAARQDQPDCGQNLGGVADARSFPQT